MGAEVAVSWNARLGRSPQEQGDQTAQVLADPGTRWRWGGMGWHDKCGRIVVSRERKGSMDEKS